jgi:ankyrin repeat protein
MTAILVLPQVLECFWEKKETASALTAAAAAAAAAETVAALSSSASNFELSLAHSAQLLLQNARDGAQLTMLHLGCREGKYDVAQLLLASGAEVDSKVQFNN